MTVKTSPLTSGVEIVKLFNLFQSRRAPIVADYDDCLGYYLLATERVGHPNPKLQYPKYEITGCEAHEFITSVVVKTSFRFTHQMEAI